MIIAVTGHRPNKLGGYSYSTFRELVTLAKIMIDELKPERVITGMAIGWDQAVAQACVEKNIPFDAYVPCDNQDSPWPPESRKQWKELIAKAAHVVNVSPGSYETWKMQRRNQAMVDACEVVVALWDGSRGGTHNCVQYAQSAGVTLINYWDKWRDLITP